MKIQQKLSEKNVYGALETVNSVIALLKSKHKSKLCINKSFIKIVEDYKSKLLNNLLKIYF